MNRKVWQALSLVLLIALSGTFAPIGDPGGGGGTVRMKEVDGAPDVGAVSSITVPNGSLTDGGGGAVTFAPTVASIEVGVTGVTAGTASSLLYVGAGPTLAQVSITGLVVGNGAAAPSAYAGCSQANQVIRVLGADGACTFTQITSAYVDTSVWTGTVASGLLKASSQGVVAQATAGTDYATPAAANTWADNVRQVFNPGANAAGINVGSAAAAPDTPVNGDLYYDTTNGMQFRHLGAWVGPGVQAEADTLATVFARGDTITATEAAPLKIRGSGGQSTSGWNIYQHSGGTSTIKCVTSGVEGDCDPGVQLSAGKKYQLKDSGGNTDFEYDEATGAITAITVNEETSGVNITRVMELVFPLASCNGGSASGNVNDDATGATAPTASCNDTGSIQDPSLDFSGSAVTTAQLPKFRLPTGWTGNIDFTLRYVQTAAAPSGNVEWDISTVCRAIAESWDAAFNAAQTITDAAGSQNQANDATQTALTTTGCAAGEDLTIKISRDGTNDTNNDLAKATEAIVTLRATK